MSDSTPTATASRWLLALTIIGSALAVGSQHTVVLCIDAAALAVATYLAWHKAEPYRARPAATLLLVTGLGLTTWTLLQTIPLPMSVLSAIAPENADVWSRALSPLKEPGPTWAPISLDPGATRVQVLRGVTYLLAFLTALRVAHRREGSIFLERALVASAVIMALAALLHPAFGATKVLGLYEPVHVLSFSPRHIAPLLNQNHLVGYLNLGMCVALGGVLTSHPTMLRVLGGAAVVLLLAVAIWGGSRGGMGSMVAGALLIGLMWRASMRSDRGRSLTVPVAGGLALLGLGMLVIAMSEDAWQEIHTTDLTKLVLAKQVVRMTRSFPIFGVGRGAFESTFPAFRQGVGYWVFTHPENVVMQFVSEWGWPIGVATFAAMGFALRPTSVLARSRPPIGPWGALACLALHNLVDFSSEIPAFMIALSVCAAIVVAGVGSSATRVVDAWPSRPRQIALGGSAAAAGAVLFVLSGGPLLNEEQLAMQRRALDAALPREAFHAEIRRSMLAHPADPYFPFIGAVRAARAEDESIVPWVGRALERSPVFGRAHLLLARWLIGRSRPQARLEYRLAMEQDSQLGIANELPRLVRGYDDATELVPEGPVGAPVIEKLVGALGDRLPASCVRLDADLLQRTPDALSPLVRAAERTIADMAAGDAAPWCATEMQKCAQAGMALARRVSDKQPDLCMGPLLRARCKAQAGDARGAIDDLEASAERVVDRTECQKKLLGLALEAHEEDARVTAIVDRVARAGCGTATECGDHFAYLARIEESRGKQRRALAFYKQAVERAPERDDLLADAARVASLVGLHAEALDGYEKLARRHPEEATWVANAAAERAAIARGVLQRR